MYDDNLPLRRDSAIKYILDHETLSADFLSQRVREDDHITAMDRLTEGKRNPVIYANLLINNISLAENERASRAIELVRAPGNTTVVIGAKRFGKTATIFSLIERWLSEGMTVFWYGYSHVVKKIYPEIRQTFNTRKVEGAVLVVDEAAVHDPSRGFMTKEQSDRMAQIFTQGHSDYSSVYISQTFRIDIRILNTMDVLWLKPFFQLNFDREEAGDFFSEAYDYIRPIHKEENLVINCQENNCWFFRNNLPDKWCDGLSKPFARIKLKADAIEYLNLLLDAGIKGKEAGTWLDLRGWSLSELLPGVENGKNEQKALLYCPKCKSTDYMRQGFYKGRQKYCCKNCSKIFYG